MRYVKTKDLQPGMMLSSNLYDNNENILLKANMKLNPFYIDKIEALSYDGLYIYEENDVNSRLDIISEETRIQAVKSLKHLNIDDCLYLANQILEEVRGNEDMVVEMVNLSSYDNYTYVHSVNVDILSVVIGIGAGFTNDELKRLSEAALLHDVGKTCVDVGIINKPGRLTEKEYREVQQHSAYGYRMLRENENISSVVRNAVFSHHENEDGSGYPRHLTGERIHKFAKIIHIADVYDALTAKRSYKDAMNPMDAIEYLMANVGKMFDKNMVEIFLKYIAPYPVGTKVQLSTGEQAVVLKNRQLYFSRPVIRLAGGSVVDLKKKLNITITASLM